MSEILTILSFLIIFLIFSEFKRRKNKRFNTGLKSKNIL